MLGGLSRKQVGVGSMTPKQDGDGKLRSMPTPLSIIIEKNYICHLS